MIPGCRSTHPFEPSFSSRSVKQTDHCRQHYSRIELLHSISSNNWFVPRAFAQRSVWQRMYDNLLRRADCIQYCYKSITSAWFGGLYDPRTSNSNAYAVPMDLKMSKKYVSSAMFKPSVRSLAWVTVLDRGSGDPGQFPPHASWPRPRGHALPGSMTPPTPGPCKGAHLNKGYVAIYTH